MHASIARMERTILHRVIEAAMELGFSSMKPEQVEVAVAQVEGRDVFVILPTDFGKSLCYACLPVVFDKCQKKERGYSIFIVTPLVAIMKDQVRSGNGWFIHKHFIQAYINRLPKKQNHLRLW